jgi:hypothetical protein
MIKLIALVILIILFSITESKAEGLNLYSLHEYAQSEFNDPDYKCDEATAQICGLNELVKYTRTPNYVSDITGKPMCERYTPTIEQETDSEIYKKFDKWFSANPKYHKEYYSEGLFYFISQNYRCE